MAKFKIQPTTNVAGYFTAKLKGALTPKDVGKSVKLSTDASDTYELCAVGDGIDAFIVALNPATADGLVVGTLNNRGYVRCQCPAASTVGAFVSATAQAAIGTAQAGGVPSVATRVKLATDGASWRIVSGNSVNGVIAAGDTTVIIERV